MYLNVICNVSFSSRISLAKYSSALWFCSMLFLLLPVSYVRIAFVLSKICFYHNIVTLYFSLNVRSLVMFYLLWNAYLSYSYKLMFIKLMIQSTFFVVAFFLNLKINFVLLNVPSRIFIAYCDITR